MTRTPPKRASLLVGVLALTATLTTGCNRPMRAQDASGDNSLANLNRSARALVESGDPRAAIPIYQRALENAHRRDDRAAAADAHYNLAVCHYQIGEHEQALRQVRSAQTAAAGAEPAEFQLLEATVLFAMNDTEAARDAADRAIAATTSGPPQVVAALHALRGLVACRLGDLETARSELAQIGGRSGSLVARARLSGTIAVAEKRFADAGADFDAEAEEHRKARRYRAMAEALARSGAAWADVPDAQRGADRYLRAGRSAAAQRDMPEVRAWLDSAVRLARAAGDESIANEAQALAEHPASRR